MKIKRKIIAVSGARSEYDLLYTTYEKLNTREDVDFGIIITGPNLSEKYGRTGDYIEKDGFKIIEKIYNLLDSDEKLARVSSIGIQIPQLAQSLNREKPDIVLVAGDREESISVTMVCAYMDIPVAHFFGGDIAKDGNIDNSVRYAAGKFAHIHFPTLEEHKENLIRLGENDWRIFVVGNPALDRFLSTPIQSKTKILRKLHADGWEKRPYCVLIQHSIITEVEQQDKHIRETLEAIRKSHIPCFINFPNSDAGSLALINAYQEYSRNYPEQFILFKNLDRETYINLLRNAHFLIGNSSSGLLEAPSLGLPAINVGSRQRGRVHGTNVIFVENIEFEIAKAIQFVQSDNGFLDQVKNCVNPYGDGKSSDKIVEVLTTINLDNNLIHKNITY
ncbi:UDP-N-acetylglucosamine 2-epimerase (hydrolyzing) [Cyclobacteriaceae bacterium YHN15]|nr:UDP-N-acetylglucosamine 2-epimerase (hydrolyzing) [Cyclobacteriaceae bacterium YHN15]